MVAVVGHRNGGVVVADVLAREKVGPVRQDDVVFGEAFLHRGERGNDNDETGAEPEREDLAIF